MKKSVLIIMMITIICKVNAQTKENIKYTSFNIVTQAIIGSIGSVIHKRSNQSYTNAALNGFWKGSLAGLGNSLSMNIIKQSSEHNTLAYVMPARLLNSLSSSFLYNATSNKSIFNTLTLDLYCFNLQYSKQNKFNVRLDPISLGYAGYLSFQKDMSFNFKNTLLTGSILFDQKSDGIIHDGNDFGNIRDFGKTIGNTLFQKTTYINYYKFHKITTEKNGKTYTFYDITKYVKNITNQTISHEIIHTFQGQMCSNLNILSTDLICEKLNLNLNKYLYINPNFGILYSIANMNKYKNNIYEHQANYYGVSNYLENKVSYY